jgi:hypothetical protein
MACFPSSPLTQRSPSVKKIWYESNREGDGKVSSTLGVKTSNFIALLIMLVLVLQPLLIIATNCWPQTLAGRLGTIRRTTGILTVHVGLLVYLPCTIFLLRALLGQKRGIEMIKLAALLAFCTWQAWVSMQGAISVWTRLCHWLGHFYNG